MRRNAVPPVFALALAATVSWTVPAFAQSAGSDGQAPAIGPDSLRRDLMVLTQTAPRDVPLVEGRAMAVALGAIGGVVVFNLATGGTGALPFLASAAAAEFGPLTATGGAVAVSRVYAVTSAAVGGLFADWLYRTSSDATAQPAMPTSLLRRIEPPADFRHARYDTGDTGNRPR